MALGDAGHQVVAIDTNPDVVAMARARGVDARVAKFPEFDETPFDVVLFTRSLHHIPSLTEAIKGAHRLLIPGGTIIVEEMAWEILDRTTAIWAYGLMNLSKTLGIDVQEEWNQSDDVLEQWREENRSHQLSTGRAMIAAVFTFLSLNLTIVTKRLRRPFNDCRSECRPDQGAK